MRAFARLAGLLLAFSVIAGCGAASERPNASAGPALRITGVEIHNRLLYPVQDVTILVPATGDYASCGQLFPGTSCSNTFPGRVYRSSAVQLSWSEHGQPQSTRPFTLKAPFGTREGRAARIRVEIFAAGQAGAELVLVEPQKP